MKTIGKQAYIRPYLGICVMGKDTILTSNISAKDNIGNDKEWDTTGV